MDITTALSGALPAIILVSAVLTVIFSLILLRGYQRAVIRSMRGSGGMVRSSESGASEGNSLGNTDLAISVVNAGASGSGRSSPAFNKTTHSLHQLRKVYGLAGIVYAAVLSLPWMLTAGGGFPLMRFIWLFSCYLWPAIVVISFVAAVNRKEKQILIGGYFAVVSLVGLISLLRNVDLSLGQLLFFWVYANGAPTLLLSLLLMPKIRAVSPMVLAFMVTGVTGAAVFVSVVGADDSLISLFAEFGYQVGLGATSVFILLHLIGFALLGVVGWWLLGRLGQIYRKKSVSDETIKVDAIWLMFAVLQSITLAFEGWLWIFTGLVAFAIYKMITKKRFSNISVHAKAEEIPSLLLLRVFSLGDRSERLFESLSKRWLRLGSIDMIAGPDLVTSTIEPHEFLAYVGGELSRSFINSPTELDERIAHRDQHPDPDGRYRVNEFFCRDDTWQMCVQALAAKNGVVLMDLRSFSRQNQGCVWEIEQLFARVSLERVIFTVDETTDLEFLKERFRSLMSNLSLGSPNEISGESEIKLVAITSSLSTSADYLVERLLDASHRTTDIEIELPDL